MDLGKVEVYVGMKIEYMNKNKVCTVINIDDNTKEITFKNVTDKFYEYAFGKKEKIDIKDLYDLYEDRCIPRSRAKVVYELWGIPYEPYLIVKHTHGVLAHDCFWIRFEGEDIKWEDIDPRKDEIYDEEGNVINEFPGEDIDGIPVDANDEINTRFRQMLKEAGLT